MGDFGLLFASLDERPEDMFPGCQKKSPGLRGPGLTIFDVFDEVILGKNPGRAQENMHVCSSPARS